MSKMQTISQFWQFIKYKKKFWLLPIVIVLVMVGALLVFGQNSALAPFIYALF
jgi:hypothetical protein